MSRKFVSAEKLCIALRFSLLSGSHRPRENACQWTGNREMRFGEQKMEQLEGRKDGRAKGRSEV